MPLIFAGWLGIGVDPLGSYLLAQALATVGA